MSLVLICYKGTVGIPVPYLQYGSYSIGRFNHHMDFPYMMIDGCRNIANILGKFYSKFSEQIVKLNKVIQYHILT